jgi:hypothetical protein
MLQVVQEYYSNLRKDGTLWGCGHRVEDLAVDENGQVVCAVCSGYTAPERQLVEAGRRKRARPAGAAFPAELQGAVR